MLKLFRGLSLLFLSISTVTVTGHWVRLASPWTNRVFLDEDKTFELKYNTNDPTSIVMEITADSNGYVAVGFSPDGGMNGSDIVMGWVDASGVAHIKDLHGVGNTKPVEDSEPNYQLLGGYEIDNKTTIQFRRSWLSCDKKDQMLVDGNLKVIWAFNQEDPKLADEDGVFRPPYHFEARGSKDVEINYLGGVGNLKNVSCANVVKPVVFYSLPLW